LRYHIYLVTMSSGKRNVTVWRPSICLSVCPVGILTVTHQGAALRRDQRTFWPDNKDDRHTCMNCHLFSHLESLCYELRIYIFFTLVASSGKRNVGPVVWRPSVCLSLPSAYTPWLTRGQHAMMRRGQCTFRPDNKEDRHTCVDRFPTQCDCVLADELCDGQNERKMSRQEIKNCNNEAS